VGAIALHLTLEAHARKVERVKEAEAQTQG
jgi:hypothetical protein